MKRRDFIKLSTVTACFLMAPLNVYSQTNKSKKLVLIELHGGNDSLNCVVPYNHKVYKKSRPTLAIAQNDLNIIDDNLGLNKNLSTIYNLYREKNVAIVNGLGYENPNLSHFKSIEYVESGTSKALLSPNGWLSKLLLNYKIENNRPTHALVVGQRGQGVLFDENTNVLKIRNIDKFIKASRHIYPANSDYIINPMIKHIIKQEKYIVNAKKSFKTYIQNENTEFPDTSIGNDLKEVLKIVKSNLKIPIFKVAQGSYDTHANQTQRQNQLFSELDDALGVFVKELKKHNLFDDIIIMTYSEFGRRVKENGSLGTDHGTASSQFVIGGSIKGGLYGKYPNLNDLDEYNLKYTTHYASLYNTILSKHFNYGDKRYEGYKQLSFL